MTASRDLWAMTSYFNPAGYRRRLANYRLFRRRLSLPLLTVEWSGGRAHELHVGDADILLQLDGGDVMWQKERLLNVALAALPAECRKFVWLDCDLLFDDDDWPTQVSDALDEFPLVQPYRQVAHIARDAPCPEPGHAPAIVCRQPSLLNALHAGQVLADALRLTPGVAQRPLPLGITEPQYLQIATRAAQAGFAWAARRETIERHGFYDVRIGGGGDIYFVCAAFGAYQDLVRLRRLNEPEAEHYVNWAEPFFGTIRGAATYLDRTIYHLWHGNLLDRRYRIRHEELRAFQFDPRRDLRCAVDGPWCWSSDKPLMHEYIRDYFASRREDG